MQKNVNPVDKNSRAYLLSAARGGRYAVLMVIGFTIVNVMMVLLNVQRYFLFSASLPYYMTLIAKLLDNGGSLGALAVNGRLTRMAAGASLVILTGYFVCWVFGKEKRGWLTAALVLFGIDTVVMAVIDVFLLGNAAGSIMDIFLHGWAIWQMVTGVKSMKKLENMPTDGE